MASTNGNINFATHKLNRKQQTINNVDSSIKSTDLCKTGQSVISIISGLRTNKKLCLYTDLNLKFVNLLQFLVYLLFGKNIIDKMS